MTDLRAQIETQAQTIDRLRRNDLKQSRVIVALRRQIEQDQARIAELERDARRRIDVAANFLAPDAASRDFTILGSLNTKSRTSGENSEG